MKKFIFVSMLSLSLSSSVSADLESKYEDMLDLWQARYPVVKVLRERSDFKNLSHQKIQGVKEEIGTVGENKYSLLSVFKQSIQEVVESIIKIPNYSKYKTLYYLVEGLDPVYRDAADMAPIQMSLPCIGESIYEVHNVKNEFLNIK